MGWIEMLFGWLGIWRVATPKYFKDLLIVSIAGAGESLFSAQHSHPLLEFP